MNVEQSYIHNYDNSVAVKYGDPNIYFHLRWHCNHKLCGLFEQKNTSIVFQQKFKKNSRWQSLHCHILHKTIAKHQTNVARFQGLTNPMTISARITKSKQCLRTWGTEHYNINRLTVRSRLHVEHRSITTWHIDKCLQEWFSSLFVAAAVAVAN